MLNLIILLAYSTGFAAFAGFYSREEGTWKAKVTAVVGVIVALVLSLFSLPIGGGLIVAATFYVADRKNRNRAWAIPAILFGPIILLIVVSLPKLADEGTLSLTS